MLCPKYKDGRCFAALKEEGAFVGYSTIENWCRDKFKTCPHFPKEEQSGAVSLSKRLFAAIKPLLAQTP